VYADELTRLAETLDMDTAQAAGLVTVDRDLICFYIPQEARWTIAARTTPNPSSCVGRKSSRITSPLPR
jgi:hypothetical protein